MNQIVQPLRVVLQALAATLKQGTRRNDVFLHELDVACPNADVNLRLQQCDFEQHLCSLGLLLLLLESNVL